MIDDNDDDFNDVDDDDDDDNDGSIECRGCKAIIGALFTAFLSCSFVCWISILSCLFDGSISEAVLRSINAALCLPDS